MAKKKKSALKPVANRGFATTSTPSKNTVQQPSISSESKNVEENGKNVTTKADRKDINTNDGATDDAVGWNAIENEMLSVENNKKPEFDPAKEEEQALQNVVERLRDRVEKDVARFWKTIEFDRRFSKQLPIFEMDPQLRDDILNSFAKGGDKEEGAAAAKEPEQEDDISSLLEHVWPSSAASELLQKALVTHSLLLRLGFTAKQAIAALSECQSVTDIDECVACLVGALSLEELEDVERRCEGKSTQSSRAKDNDKCDDETDNNDSLAIDDTRPPSHRGFTFERASTSGNTSRAAYSGSSTPLDTQSGSHTPTVSSTEAKEAIEDAKVFCNAALRSLDDQDQIDSLEKPDLAYAQARLFIIQADKKSTHVEKLCKGETSPELNDVRRKWQSVKAKARVTIDDCQISPNWHKVSADNEFQRLRMDWEEEEGKIDAAKKAKAKADLINTMEQSNMLSSNGDGSLESAVNQLDTDEGGLFGDLLDEQATEVMDTSTQTKITLFDLPPQAIKVHGSKAPRSILSDALRRRNPSATIRYEPIATGGRMFRSRLTMRWMNGLADIYTMTGMATLSQTSADDVMAIAALMCIDSRADKTLSAGFREWWDELSECKKGEKDDLSRKQFKNILTVLGPRLEAANRDAEETKKALRAKQSLTKPADSIVEDALADEEDRPEHRDEAGKRMWNSHESSKSFQNMLPGRQNLPIAAYKEHFLEILHQNQVVVLSGETGCGKSTQIPSFILEQRLQSALPCKILVTEPRRISAISLAERVSAELGEHKGAVGKDDSLIGSAVRLENNIGRNARLIYATTGIVLRMLEAGQLDDVSHIIVDEVHERSIESDFLLIILKSLMNVRKDLKVVLMSATLDAERISAYFGGCPTVNVPGRTFPVEVHWLEDAVELCDYIIEEGSTYARRRNRRNGAPNDVNNAGRLAVTGEEDEDELDENEEQQSQPSNISANGKYRPKTVSTLDRMDENIVNHDLIVSLLEQMCFGPAHLQQYSAATLIFLPGIAEIRKLHDLLQAHKRFGTREFQIWPLHSTITSENQSLVFDLPPEGVRKIVLSTNIAETGITIPDITCVIDTGKHREMRFDEKRQLSKLVECFVARSNAKQRRGRAGRVQNGICWHLFTRFRHDSFLAEHPIPEILRLSLQDLALKLKVMKVKIGNSIEDALSKALDAPSSINVQRSVASLVEIKALTTNEDITPLGRQLSRLPLDVYMAKFLLIACNLRVLDSALTIAATLNAKSPFNVPFGRELEARAAKKSFDAGDNDFVTMVRAFNAWRRSTENGVGRQFCQKCFLNMTNLIQIEELRQQYMTYLLDAGYVQVTNQERSEIVGARFRFHSAKTKFMRVPAYLDENSASLSQVNAALVTALYPKLLSIDSRNGQLKTLTNNAPAAIHPSSVNFKLHLGSLHKSIHHLVYFTIMQSRRLYAWETGAIDDRALMMLCGEADFKFSAKSLYIDRQRIRTTFYDLKTALALRILRQRMTKLLQTSYRTPGKEWSQEDQELFAFACAFIGVGANDKDRVVI